MKPHPLPIIHPTRKPRPMSLTLAALQVAACILLSAAGVAAVIALIELTPRL